MADQYSPLERRIARQLAHFPLLKGWVKQGYARVAYHLSGGRGAAALSLSPLQQIGPDDADTFFGYYDKTPLSENGWLLCHTAYHSSHRRPRADRSIAVQIFDFLSGDSSRPIMSLDTASYNWQQGARAHWLDGDHFIFNDFDPQRQHYISRVASASERRETQRYDNAVQDSWKRDYFLSIDYRRLQALRPEYGYSNLPPLDSQALASLEDDGIRRVEQGSGASRLLYSLRDICQVEGEECFRQARHKVNHVMIAPDGRQFIFLHRYFIGRRKYDRLMLAAADGSGLRVLSANGMVSHCFWINGGALLCYLRGPTGRDGYHIVDTLTGRSESLFAGALDTVGDGHPHIHDDWFVTDTYPDRRRMQHLIKANLRTGKITELGRFVHSFRYGGETRCDLHPRIAPDGRQVFFDSVCSGRRRLYCLETEPREERQK